MDPLTAATESLAPSRASTNFFSPAAGSDVLARFGRANMEAPAAEKLAEASSRLEDSRFERSQRRRQETLWDRDDRDYMEKQEFKAQRGGFLETIASIDANADDYEETMSQLLTTLPPEALDDDAVLAIKASKDRVFEKRMQEMKESRGREETFQNQQRIMQQKDTVKAALAGLSPEELDSFRDPATRELDVAAAMYAAGQKKRENDQKSFEGKEAVRQANRKEMVASTELTKEAKEQKALAAERIKGDTAAFPTAMQELLTAKGTPGLMAKDLQTMDAAGYAAAVAADRAPEARWLERARDTDSPEAFIAKYGGDRLTPPQKEKYRQVWSAAQSAVRVIPEPEPGNAAPAAPAAPAVPAGVTSVRVIDGVQYGLLNGKWARL